MCSFQPIFFFVNLFSNSSCFFFSFSSTSCFYVSIPRFRCWYKPTTSKFRTLICDCKYNWTASIFEVAKLLVLGSESSASAPITCSLECEMKFLGILGYTLVYRLRLNKNLEYTKYRQKYIESEYISHFGRK